MGRMGIGIGDLASTLHALATLDIAPPPDQAPVLWARVAGVVAAAAGGTAVGTSDLALVLWSVVVLAGDCQEGAEGAVEAAAEAMLAVVTHDPSALLPAARRQVRTTGQGGEVGLGDTYRSILPPQLTKYKTHIGPPRPDRPPPPPSPPTSPRLDRTSSNSPTTTARPPRRRLLGSFTPLAPALPFQAASLCIFLPYRPWRGLWHPPPASAGGSAVRPNNGRH